MSWTAGCSGGSNEELVARLAAAGLVSTPAVRAAMLATDRALYVPPGDPGSAAAAAGRGGYQYGPYADAPQSIGSKVTISAPHIHATCLEALAGALRTPGARVLDVGCGSGILLAYMARMAPASAALVGLEIVGRLAERSAANLRADGFAVGDDPRDGQHARIEVRQGDGWQGAADLGPFDAINVGAAAAEVPPALLAQLRPGGLLLIPLGERQSNQELALLTARDGGVERRALRTVRFVPLVEDSPPAKAAGVDWNARYRKGWAYGKAPSAWLASVAPDRLAPGARVLCLGEGQGRNAVYLAAELGASCLAVDASSVGLAKARRLAKQRGAAACLATECADLGGAWRPEPAAFDAVVSIFCMLPPPARQRLHAAAAAALRPGGEVLIECFAPTQARQREEAAAAAERRHPCGEASVADGADGKERQLPWCPGPSAECLVSWQELAADFEGLEVKVGEEVEVVLREGAFHRGRARLTRFVAAKPATSAELRAAPSPASHLDGPDRPSSYRQTVDDLFVESTRDAARIQRGEPTGDALLDAAAASVSAACAEARSSGWCRYCWTPAGECFCAALRQRCLVLGESARAPGAALALHFVLLSHPTEFLRSTSSTRVAVPYLEALDAAGLSAELLVLGSSAHETRLDELLRGHAASRTVLLFPRRSPAAAEPSAQPGDNGANDKTVYDTSPDCPHNAPSLSVAEALAPADGNSINVDANDSRKTVVVVPDGSWACARALVDHLQPRRAQLLSGRGDEAGSLPCVALQEAAVAAHVSPLIEALKPGQGRGRLSTLEAVALFVREAGRPEAAACLTAALSPLVDFEQAAAEGPALPPGVSPSLRMCAVCGENLASPSRMPAHVRSRRHCAAVAEAALREGLDGAPLQEGGWPPSTLASLLARHSTRVLAATAPEPPDVGLLPASRPPPQARSPSPERCTSALSPREDNTACASTAGGQHRDTERPACARAPATAHSAAHTLDVAEPSLRVELEGLRVARPEGLPASMRAPRALSFDPAAYPLAQAAATLLAATPAAGRFPASALPAGAPRPLEEFVPAPGMFANFKTRQALYNAVAHDTHGVLPVYEAFVRDVCCPALKAELLRHAPSLETSGVSFWYQYPPSMRLQPGPCAQRGRTHCDLEYGHQPGELNFWLPLTDTGSTRTTLQAETRPGAGDFQDVPACSLGQVAIFHGALCRHYAPPNRMHATRCSLDFRVGIAGYFDPSWRKPGLPRSHGWRQLHL
eukprot:jgi/Tetstr1/433616/TSEL_022881.t1